MSRFKLALVAAAVTLGCCVAAPAAGAAGWMVGGAQLSGTAKIAPTDAASYSEVSIPGATVRCEATSVEVGNGTIGSPASLLLPSVTFKGCKTTAAECELVGNEIEVSPLSGAEITLEGPLAIGGKLSPKPTIPFAELEFEGEACPLSGAVFRLKGGVDFLAPEAQDERTSQSILWFSLPNQLTVGVSQAEFHFHGSLSLEGGRTWSFL